MTRETRREHGAESKDAAPIPRRSGLVLWIETALHTVLFPGTVMVGLPAAILGATAHTFPTIGWQQVFAALLIGLGATIGSYCTWDFIRAGKGTPNPLDPPRFLGSRRLYRHVRNPMYVGVELILLGEAVLFGSWALFAYAVVVWGVFHLFVVLYEEPTLRRNFGAMYDAYCRRVPRWLPRLTPAAGA